MTQAWIPASFWRGGTSKGVFFHARDLPTSRAEIDPIVLAVLGTPDPYGRQLNGMGGGISSLSKAVIIGPSTHPDADVDYTFIQVAVDRPMTDWSCNCGNLSSVVGPYAIGAIKQSTGSYDGGLYVVAGFLAFSAALTLIMSGISKRTPQAA